jgi:thiamine biosynthesis lipoprotein
VSDGKAHTDNHTEEAGSPTAGRLLIPVGLKPAAVRASRIDAPIRRLSGVTMGTGWSLSYAAPDSVENSRVVATLEDVFARVIQQMSNWEPNSDLSRFNRTPGWHDLKPDFFKVLSRALEIANLTNGVYNPALATTVDAAGFGPSSISAHPDVSRDPGQHTQVSEPLDPDLRRDERSEASWKQIGLDPTNQRAFQPGNAALDLSSIAKGHAVDLCAQALNDLSIPSFLMEIGGEFVGQGVKPDAQPWWVQLELSDIAPAPTEPPHTDLALVNLAVATSGDYIRRRDGVSHLLDGRTGQPVANTLSGVTVMHASCMDADAWATALFALGENDGLAMANAQNLAAIFSTRTPEGARLFLSATAQEMLG